MHIKAVVLNSKNSALGAIFQQEINLHKGVGATIAIDKSHTQHTMLEEKVL
jgi:hexosaminidase